MSQTNQVKAPQPVPVEEEDYDPHLHRNLPKPTNNFETLVHLLKCSIGTGIVAMPQAFANSGLLTGVIGTLLVGFLLTHCLHVLVRAQYIVCKRRRVPLLSYPEAMTAALEAGPKSLRWFAGPSAFFVDLFNCTFQLGVCCVYILFIAKNIKKMVDPYYPLSVEVHMLILLGPLVAFNLIPSLKLLAPFSAFANVIQILALGIIFYYLAQGQRKDLEKLDPPLTMNMWGQLTTYPLFFGTVMFALTSIGVVVALENNMKTPKKFLEPFGVLNIGMTIIVAIYTSLGAIGYKYCVSQCHDSVTLDLPQGPLALAVLVLFSVAIFITYGLQCFVPVDVMWKGYLAPRLTARNASARTRKIAEYSLRIGLCLLTFVLAATVPRLGLFISLFGALCLSALGFCFPALMELCLAYPDHFGPCHMRLFKDLVLIVAGLIGLVAGTYTALLGIILSFTEPA